MRTTVLILLAFFLAACGTGGATPTDGPELTSTLVSPAPGSPIALQDPATQAPPSLVAATPTAPPLATTLPARPGATATTALFFPTITVQATITPGEPSQPGEFPDPRGYTWAPVAGGLAAPIGIAHAGDGSGRLFVIEQIGRIRLLRNNQLLETPFLDIVDRVGSAGSEQGLLGLAFHPNYAQNGLFYVNYTDQAGDTVIARFNAPDPAADRADPGSFKLLLSFDQPYANHNGGALAFGPDGFLYVGSGDGGSGGDPQGNGQRLDTLLGKILRLDVDSGDPYAIPPNNPFAAGGGRAEIWAYGLRNPWRLSFDRLTGDLYTGDVGQGSFEEVNFQPASSAGGENYGWNNMEGFECFGGAACDPAGLTPPISVYGTHSQGSCAITGGYVYRGAALPAWQGVYIFGDYCSGIIWGLLRDAQGNWQEMQLYENVARITSFGEDETGEIYLSDYAGNLLKLVVK